MDNYTQSELQQALQIVSSTIINCEKMQHKFIEGSSQRTLLKNRIKALYISKTLINNDADIADKYTLNEIKEALLPITSIINKCKKAIVKFDEGTSNYMRFNNMIKAMSFAKSTIKNYIIINYGSIRFSEDIISYPDK